MIINRNLLKLLSLVVLLLGTRLHADDACECENQSSLYYMKFGAQLVPGERTIVLPTLGLGARYQWDRHGCDFSVNGSSLIFFNYFSFKALYLYYPMPERKNQLYFGVGPSIGYYAGGIPGPGDCRGCGEYGCVNLEGLVGYEFRHSRHFKTFVQLELTQPAIYTHSTRKHGHYAPGVAITGGLGF